MLTFAESESTKEPRVQVGKQSQTPQEQLFSSQTLCYCSTRHFSVWSLIGLLFYSHLHHHCAT